MAKVAIDISGQAYMMPAVQLDAQTCVNFYPISDPTGKYPVSLAPTPGLEVWAEIADKPEVRGLFQLNGVLYAAIGSGFYTIDGNANETLLGSMNSSVGNVRFAANDNQVFISDGKSGYVYQIVKTDTRDPGDFFEITEASSIIGEATFVGAGLDDMTSGGTYTGLSDKKYIVEIDGVGTTDTFKWSDDDGNTFSKTGVSITGAPQQLNDGVAVTFSNTVGHTRNDKWKFSAVIDSAFYTPLVPAYQDGYGVYTKQVSNTFYISSINDFSVINALDFASSNLWPDHLVAAASVKEELWMIGNTTTEIWYDSGAADFPFAPRTNLLIQYGTRDTMRR